jgi:hypothetical protein
MACPSAGIVNRRLELRMQSRELVDRQADLGKQRERQE